MNIDSTLFHDLNKCQSLGEVVEMVNQQNPGDPSETGCAYHYSSEQAAAIYACDAAKESGYAIDSDSLEAHLEVLANDGASFDSSEALEIARSIVANYEEYQA